MTISNQTQTVLSDLVGNGVTSELVAALNTAATYTGTVTAGAFTTGGTLNVGTIVSTGTIAAASSSISALVITGTSAGSFGGVVMTANGVVFPSFTTTNRDLIATPSAGQTIYNTTTAKLNFYNGSAWAAVTSV